MQTVQRSGKANADDGAILLTRRELAKRLSVSPRTIDNFQRQRKIAFIRISPRCVRFNLQAVLRALSRFEIREVGRLRPNG